MSDPNQPSVPPGWYADGQGGQRWWDGTQWTEHTRPQPPQAPPPAPPAPPQQYPIYGGPQQPYGQPLPPTRASASGRHRGLIIALGAGGGALVVLLLLVMGLRALGGGGPDDVAKDYLGATFESDFETVCELTAADQRDALLDGAGADDCDDFADRQEDQEGDESDRYEDDYDLSLDDIRDNFDHEVEIRDVDERGDEAIVEVRQTTEYEADDEFLRRVLDGDRRQSRTFAMRLVKEDGDWRVADSEYAGG